MGFIETAFNEFASGQLPAGLILGKKIPMCGAGMLHPLLCQRSERLEMSVDNLT